MALSETLRIIWLDAYIGKDDKCHSFKRMFCTTLESTARYGDPLDILICALNENAAPFTFVDTPEKAIEQIEFYHDKHIIFITSGSLGQQVIPHIASTYHHVYSFYIFCAVLENHIDLVLTYKECLQIFTSEHDLLVRLVRDISMEIINRGKASLKVNDPQTALEYFERSNALEKTANETDKLNTAFRNHLRLLNGYGDDIGLIQTAHNMIELQQQEEIQDTAQEPFIAESKAEEHDEFEYEHPDPRLAQPEIEQNDRDSPIAVQIFQEEE
jgi:hypothetical protein